MKNALIFVALLFSASCAPVQMAVRDSIAQQNEDGQAPRLPVMCDPADKYCIVHIPFDVGVDDLTANIGMAAIEAANEVKAAAILLELNSPGGSVEAGFKLAKAIENSHVPVVCVVDGEAASMSFFLLQSCDVRLMTKRSRLMAHQPSMSGNFRGTEEEWRNVAEALRVLTIAMSEHMCHKLKMPIKECQSRMIGSAQWWMDWSEAKKLNAVDNIVPSVNQMKAQMSKNFTIPVL
jgi:ATP-dependent protease ClpP protease subunit